MRPPQLALDADAAAASAVHGRLIFLLATPESGAERLLRALGALPGAAAMPAPTHIFEHGVDWLLQHWEGGEDGPQALSGLAGVQSLLLETRRLADAPYEAFLGRSGADRVVEYSPGHISFADEVAGLYPDACLVHVVRDGREVAARLSSAKPRLSPREAAKRWIDDQRLVLGVEHSDLYNVRIEDLLQDPVQLLTVLAPALGFAADDDAIARAAAEVGMARALPAVTARRAGAIVEIVGADLLRHFEYDTNTAPLPQRLAAWGDMAISANVSVGRKAGADVARHLVGGVRKVREAVAR